MIEKVPEFPDFRPFTIDDIKWYYDYYIEKKLNPYVDIHPENMLTWLNINNDLMVSRLDDGFVIKYTNVLDGNHFNIIPIMNPLKDSTIEKIMSYLGENNLPLEMHEVPSIICGELSRNKWLAENDRDSYEYILDTDQQSMLQGNNFYHRRRNIGIFKRMYPSEVISVQYYKQFDDDVKKSFLHHIDTMPFNSRKEASQKNLVEPIAIRKNLKYASAFHKRAMIIKINDEIVSIAMFSYLDNHTAAINHIKVNYSIQDIFKYTVYCLASTLKEDNMNEMNMEQDLGMEGLRAYKIKLQPSRLLEKKIIRPRPQ